MSESANPMDGPWVELTKWPYDDPLLHFRLRAADGGFAAEQEFYLDGEEMAELGRRLQVFLVGAASEIILSLGERGGGGPWVQLRCWLSDSVGRVALTIDVGNNRSGADRREACFTIRCEAAALNSLGARLVRWIATDEPSVRVDLAGEL